MNINKKIMLLAMLCSASLINTYIVEQKEAVGLTLPAYEKPSNLLQKIDGAKTLVQVLTGLQRVDSWPAIIDPKNADAIQHFPANVSTLNALLIQASKSNITDKNDLNHLCSYLNDYERVYAALTNDAYIKVIQEKLHKAKADASQLAAFEALAKPVNSIKTTLDEVQKAMRLTTSSATFKTYDPDMSLHVTKYGLPAAAPAPAPVAKPTPTPAAKPAPSQETVSGSKTVTLINWSKNYAISVQNAAGKWVTVAPRAQQQYVQIVPTKLKLRACGKSVTQCDDKTKGSFGVSYSDGSGEVSKKENMILVLDAGNSFFLGFSAKNTNLVTANILSKVQKTSYSKDIRILPMTTEDPLTTMIGKALAEAAPK